MSLEVLVCQMCSLCEQVLTMLVLNHSCTVALCSFTGSNTNQTNLKCMNNSIIDMYLYFPLGCDSLVSSKITGVQPQMLYTPYVCHEILHNYVDRMGMVSLVGHFRRKSPSDREAMKISSPQQSWTRLELKHISLWIT